MQIGVGGEHPGPCLVPAMLQVQGKAGPGMAWMQVQGVVALLSGLPGGRSVRVAGWACA